MRTAILITLAGAAFVADAIVAVRLFADGVAEPSAGGVISLDPTRVFPHVAAVIVGTISLAALTASPTFRDRAARAILFLALALPFPGIGLAVATLFTVAMALTKHRENSNSLFSVGNPHTDLASDVIVGSTDLAARRTAQPLNARIRGGDLADLRTLAIGLRGLPFDRTAPVLERLQKDPDTYLQLYAQGDAAEATESEEFRLRSLSRRADRNPDDHGARAAFAAHLLHLATASATALDQRTQLLARALDQIRGLDSPRAHALRAAIHIHNHQPEAAAEAFEKLVAADPQSPSVSKAELARLRAELLHLNRNWPQLAAHLRTPELAADPTFAPVQKFFAPAPAG